MFGYKFSLIVKSFMILKLVLNPSNDSRIQKAIIYIYNLMSRDLVVLLGGILNEKIFD